MEHCHIYEPAFSREMLSICKPSYIEYSMNVLPKKLVDESKNAYSKIIYIQTAQQKSWVQQGPFEVNQKIPRKRDQRAEYFQTLDKDMSLRIQMLELKYLTMVANEISLPIRNSNHL